MDGETKAELERVWLTLEEAIARLEVIPDYDPGGDGGPRPCVHTFRAAGRVLVGGHWDLAMVAAAVAQYGVELSGPAASGMGHGLVVIDERGPVFLATRPVEGGA